MATAKKRPRPRDPTREETIADLTRKLERAAELLNERRITIAEQQHRIQKQERALAWYHQPYKTRMRLTLDRANAAEDRFDRLHERYRSDLAAVEEWQTLAATRGARVTLLERQIARSGFKVGPTKMMLLVKLPRRRRK